ncbi:MAG: radical SAM protein [Spirochaetales bacterium]|nr:radical SAM protein [Spirochaetales bacterium]
MIRYAAKAFGKDLCFVITGGEPLVHRDLVQITAAIKDTGCRWGLVTNGILLTRERLAALEGNNLASLTLSLDGEEESHEYLRNRKGSWQAVRRALEALGQSSVPFKDAVSCIYPRNLNELDSMADILLGHNIDHWRLFRIFPSGRAKHNPNLHLSAEQTAQMISWIRNNRKKYKKAGLAIDLSCEGYLPFRIDRQVRSEPFFCRSGINFASVLVEGNITGCSNNAPGFYQGNILTDDFKSVWDKKFDIYRDESKLKKGMCADCRHFPSCRGGSIHLWESENSGPVFCYLEAAKR